MLLQFLSKMLGLTEPENDIIENAIAKVINEAANAKYNFLNGANHPVNYMRFNEIN